MATITKVITRDWYTAAPLHYTAYDGAGATLVARTAMTESPAGTGSYYATNASWNSDWTGRILFDDGSIYESESFDAAASGGTVAPTAADNAAAVRTNLATELARIDAPISGIPEASENAAAIWAAGTRTLTALPSPAPAGYGGSSALVTGTVAATTGGTTTLDASAAATADYYNNARLVLTAGTGAGQERIIQAYTAGRVATHEAWGVNPDAATSYEISPGRSAATVVGSGDATAASQATILRLLQSTRGRR